MAQDDYSLPDLSGMTLPELPDFTQTEPVARERKPRPYVKPAKVEPKPKEAETLGFVTNLPKSVLDMAKSIFIDLPVAVGTNAYHYAKDPSQYAKDVNLFLSRPGDTGDFLKHEITDYYTKDFWANFNEDPARFLQDAAMVLDGVGLAGKLGKTGGMVSKIGQGAKIGAEYLDPLRASGKLASKALARPLEALGFGEETSAIERISRHLQAREAVGAADATKKALFDKLTPPEMEELRRLLIVGNPDELDAAVARGGPVSERLKKWQDRIGSTEQPFWRSQEVLNDADMIKANAKAIDIYTRDLDGGLGYIPSDVAEGLIKEGALKPTYMSMYRLKNQSLDLFDALNDTGARGKTLGRLEQRLGNGEYLKDVDEIMSRQIHSFHQAKYKLNLVDQVKEHLLEKGKLLIVHSPQDEAAAKLLGYRELKDAFYQKYWSSFNKATALQVEQIIKAGKLGTSQLDALRLAKEAFEKAEAAGEVSSMIDKGRTFAPAHVVAWLDRELAPVSNFARLYDTWVSRYKSLATVFNPRYWAPVIFGNALLGTLYGLGPDMVKLGSRLRGDLPPVLKDLMQHEIFLRDKNWFDRKALKFGQAASYLDSIYKRGIFASEVLKDSYVRTKYNLATFFPAMNTMEDALKYFSQAPERLAVTREAISALRKKVAVSLELRDKDYRRLKRLEGRLEKEIAHLTEFRTINMSELAASIDARKDIMGKTFSDASINPKYAYFVDRFNSEIKALRTSIKNQPELIDNAMVVAAMDSAIHSVAAGHPEWLRHSLRKLQEAKSGRSPLVHRQRRMSLLVDMVGAAEERVKAGTAELLSRASDAGTLQRQIPGLAQDAAVADRAVEVAHKFYGSHYSLSPFEKRVVKRIIPFYTFTKAMTQLAFEFPFAYPKRSFMMIHLARAWNEIMQDDNAFMPSWSKNYIPVAGLKDGSVVMIRLGSLGPMSNVRMNRMGETGLPSIWDVASQNPVLRVMFEMKGGIPEWSAKPLSPGDSAVRLDNGEVIEWTGSGFKKTIAQPNVIKSLAYLFPQAQLIDSVLHQYAQTDRGWLFHPDPITGPDGKPRYPKELYNVILSTVLAPSTSVKPGELEQRERAAVAQVAKEYQRELRTASPARRLTLIESLREWANSQKKAIER